MRGIQGSESQAQEKLGSALSSQEIFITSILENDDMGKVWSSVVHVTDVYKQASLNKTWG